MAYSVAAAAAGASVSGGQAAPTADSGAEVIFKGGKIIPVPGAAPVKALAIAGGKSWRLFRKRRRRPEDEELSNRRSAGTGLDAGLCRPA